MELRIEKLGEGAIGGVMELLGVLALRKQGREGRKGDRRGKGGSPE